MKKDRASKFGRYVVLCSTHCTVGSIKIMQCRPRLFFNPFPLSFIISNFHKSSFLELQEETQPSQSTQVDPVPSTSAQQPPRKRLEF